jgi:hypothetical protein
MSGTGRRGKDAAQHGTDQVVSTCTRLNEYSLPRTLLKSKKEEKCAPVGNGESRLCRFVELRRQFLAKRECGEVLVLSGLHVTCLLNGMRHRKIVAFSIERKCKLHGTAYPRSSSTV